MSETLGAKFSIDITQLKAGLAAANRAIRESESEFKAAAAGMGDWTKSQDGLEKRIATLNKTADIQSAKVAALKKEYDRLIAEGLDPTSAKATNLRTQINNETAALEKSKAEIAKQTEALEKLQTESAEAAKKAESLTGKVEKQEKELADLKQKYIEVAAAKGKDSDEAKALADQISNLSGDLKENKDKLKDAADAADELDQSFEKTEKGGLASFAVALGNLAANLITEAISKMKDLVSNTIEVGKAFDSSMSQVGAVSGATGDELDALREKAKEMGASTKFTASEAADAFNYMAMAGWKTEDMLGGIEGVLNLAAASGADLATTSDIVTDALTAMGYGAEDAGRLADVMAAASSNANTNVEMMGETFKYAAPVTGALGYSMEDTAVAVGLMANSGIKASQAGTALRGTLARLTKPTDEMTAVMSQLGLITTETTTVIDSEKLKKAQNSVASKTAAMEKAQISYNAAVKKYGKDSDQAHKAMINLETAQRSLKAAQEDLEKVQQGKLQTTAKNTTLLQNEQGEMLSLMEVMQLLRDKMGDLDEAQQASAASALFGQEAMSGMLAIINASDADFEKLTSAINNSEGAAQKMAETMQDNLGGDMTKLGSKFEGIQIALYEKFEPALRKAVDALSGLLDVVNWLIDNGNEVIGVITGLATAVGAYVAYTTALQVMKNGWMSLAIVQKAVAAGQAVLNAVMNANPIGIIIAAIAGLVAAFVVLWKKSEKFRNFWIGLWEKIKAVAEPIIKGLAEWFSKAWDSIKKVWGKVSAWFAEVWEKIKNSFAFQKLVDYFRMAWENIKAVWSVVVAYFKTIWENIKLVFSAVKKVLSGDFSGAWDAIKQIFANVKRFFEENVWGAIKNIFANIDEFFGGIFSKAWEKITEIWGKVAGWFDENVVQPIKEFFAPIIDFFRTAFEIIGQLAQGCWELIKAVWSVVSGWFDENIIQPVAGFFRSLWDGIKSAASTAWNGIKIIWAVVSGWFKSHIIDPVTRIFSLLWSGIKNAAATAWNGIKAVWSLVRAWFDSTIIQPVKKIFSSMWSGVKKGASEAWSGIKGAFGGVADWFKDKFSKAWTAVKNVFSTGGKVFDGIKDGITKAFKSVVNAIIRGINKVIAIPFNAINNTLDKIRGVSIAGIEPFKNLVSRFNVPEIPLLAKGGVVRKATHAIIGEDGAEAVIPLEHNVKWIDTLAERLADKIGGGVTVNQTNNYSQAHSRYEIYKSKQATAAAVRLALMR